MMVDMASFVMMLLAVDALATSPTFDFVDDSQCSGRNVLYFRSVELGAAPPRAVTFEVDPDVAAQHGLLLVGTDLEAALAIAWDPATSAGAALWLDADGDGRISSDERHLLRGRELEIPATIRIEGGHGVQRLRRTLVFRRAALGDGLRYAVRGYRQGRLTLSGKSHETVLIDASADGLFDAAGTDRIWIDLNDDGRFDGATEQFLLGSPIRIDESLFTISTNPLGTAVRVHARSEDKGALRVRLTQQDVPAATGVTVSLVSEFGELVTIEALDTPIEVPAGRYRVDGLAFSLAESDRMRWDYRFGATRRANHYPIAVEKDEQTLVSLLEDMALDIEVSGTSLSVEPGEPLMVTPTFRAPSGLFLASCTNQMRDSVRTRESAAEIRVQGPSGKSVAMASSGFM